MSKIFTTFPADGAAPWFARRVVSGFIAGEAGPQLASDAELLTSEIVSNSVRHAGLETTDLIGMDVDLTVEHMRVSVADGGPGFEIEPPRPRDTGGWGLVLVDRISSRWGIVGDGPTIVWFELDR